MHGSRLVTATYRARADHWTTWLSCHREATRSQVRSVARLIAALRATAADSDAQTNGEIPTAGEPDQGEPRSGVSPSQGEPSLYLQRGDPTAGEPSLYLQAVGIARRSQRREIPSSEIPPVTIPDLGTSAQDLPVTGQETAARRPPRQADRPRDQGTFSGTGLQGCNDQQKLDHGEQLTSTPQDRPPAGSTCA
jgi:hypothetical protein